MSINKYAVIVAGGAGSRMHSKVPKQFLEINGKPILYFTVKTFLESYPDLQAIIVLPETYITTAKNFLSQLSTDRLAYIKGGDTRFNSVKNGLTLVPDGCIVFVHDGVRCMVSSSLIHHCFEAALEHGNAIPAVAATDSIRFVSDNDNHSVDRQQVQLIQTPQTFQSSLLKKGFEQQYQPSFTDEASVVEMMGEKVHLIEGDYRNIKVTRPLDLVIAKELLSSMSVQ